jgi:signal transduction histidine kinase
VTTELDPEGGLLRLSVEDNGCGIAAEALPHIFEAFYSSKGSEGTGLGLSVTDKIVKEHRGTIQVSSEEGKGSTFVVELPYATRFPPDQPGTSQASRGPDR